MNIIHILFCGKSGINGITQVVHSLSCAQKSIGINAVVATINTTPLSNALNWRDISNNRNFSNLIEEFSPDLIVFHSLYCIKYIPYSYILRKKHISYLITFHGGASVDNYAKHHLKKVIANYLVFNRFIRKASGVVYLNKGERNKSIFRKISGAEFIIPNGICMPKKTIFTPNASYDCISFIFLSRMDYYGKGLDVLKDTLRILVAKQLTVPIKFRFYGYSYTGEENWLDEFGDFARYCGVVYDDAKIEAIKSAQIMILPSRSEGMPLSILEGLAYGLPVLVTPETNMADIVMNNNCGWVCELDANKLAQTIVKAATDYMNDVEGYCNRSLKTASLYDWQKIAEKTKELYTEVCKK